MSARAHDLATLLAELTAQGHLIPSGEPGVYGHGATFTTVLTGVDELVTERSREDDPELLRFFPIVPRKLLDDVGYPRNFPHLSGAIMAIDADEADRTELQLTDLEPRIVSHTGLALLPAACYPAYPAIAARGPLPPGGVNLDLGPTCVFRNEPSEDPSRRQVFQQRELVRIGEPEDVLEWRDRWRARATEVLAELGLEANVSVASDPFFGKGGRLLARNQREAKLKYEAVVSIAGSGTAVASFNYHRDHLGRTFGLVHPDGETAHSACVGFGLERITTALFASYGGDFVNWPASVREALGQNAD
jgi:seryl-tRNA synthetase